MNENDVIGGFMIFGITLLVTGYVLSFIWAIKEGYKRDMLNIGLIGIALVGTPFIAAAFVASAKSDAERLIIDYEDKDGIIRTGSLSYWKKLKLSISSVKKVNDINNYCRFCDTEFSGLEKKCNRCGKSRVCYIITAYNIRSKDKICIAVSDLQNTNEEIKIKGIKRQNTPSNIYQIKSL